MTCLNLKLRLRGYSGGIDFRIKALGVPSETKVTVLMGSVRPGRFCDTVTSWLISALENNPDFALKVIDPAGLPLPGWADLQESTGAAELRSRLAESDAFIVVTPEYNHSFPAALKSVIDTAYKARLNSSWAAGQLPKSAA